MKFYDSYYICCNGLLEKIFIMHTILIAFVYHTIPNINLNSIYIENMKHTTGSQLCLFLRSCTKRDTLSRKLAFTIK